MFWTIALPGALPVIMTGFKLGIGIGLILIAIAEMIGAKSGLGFLIWSAWETFAVEQMYVGLFMIALIGFTLTVALNELERLHHSVEDRIERHRHHRLDEALAAITDGIMLAVPREVAGVPMEATRALIRRGVKRLHLVALPTSTLQADLLIGAGAIATLETSAVSLGEFGPAPRFTDAIARTARIRMLDATCPALHAAFQAAEKGVPFMPLRGILGSDMLQVPAGLARDRQSVRANPEGDPIVLLPAIRPDVALIHAPMADRAGNVWIGRQRELATMAHAATEDGRDGGEDPRRRSCSPIRCSRPASCPASMWRASRWRRERLLAAGTAGSLCGGPRASRGVCAAGGDRRRDLRDISMSMCMRAGRRSSLPRARRLRPLPRLRGRAGEGEAACSVLAASPSPPSPASGGGSAGAEASGSCA